MSKHRRRPNEPIQQKQLQRILRRISKVIENNQCKYGSFEYKTAAAVAALLASFPKISEATVQRILADYRSVMAKYARYPHFKLPPDADQ